MNGRTDKEREVELFFIEKHIKCLPEFPVLLMDDGRPKFLHPDWFLPEFGVYIEVEGFEKEFKYKSDLYKKNSIPVIFVKVYEFTPDQWKKYILVFLKNIHEERQKLLNSITA